MDKLYASDRNEYHDKLGSALFFLKIKYDYETSEMWCYRVCGPFTHRVHYINFFIFRVLREMFSPTFYQSLNCKSNTSKIYISSLFAKQNNLLPSINYLN